MVMTDNKSITNQHLAVLTAPNKLHHCVSRIFIRLIVKYCLLNLLTATLFQLFVICRSVIVLL